MNVVLKGDHFSGRRVINKYGLNEEGVDISDVHVLKIKEIRVKTLVDMVNILIKDIIRGEIDKTKKLLEGKESISEEEDNHITSELSNIGNEMLRSAFVSSETLNIIHKNITNDEKLRIITETFEPYRKRIALLLANTIKQRKLF